VPDSSSRPLSPTRFTALRAVLKGLGLYLGFLMVYSACQPVQTGRLPTLYNSLAAGRVRFITDVETNLPLMLNDHIIQQATSETWNIVMLGSSEIYGLYDVPDKALPMYLDRAGLQTADGQPVRVYNLSYPIPDAAKDLLIADALLKSGRPINLIVLNVNAWSFTPVASHDMLRTNPEATHDLIAHYHLSPTDLSDVPPDRTHNFWEDRTTLGTWLSLQRDVLRWSWLRIDNRGNGPQMTLSIDTGVNPMIRITRVELLRAFRQLSDEYHVPVLLISVPRTYSQDDFLPWLYIESQNTHLPLLDCEFIFGDVSLFIDSIHLLPTTDPMYARILMQHLSRAEMARVSPHMPLRLSADFVPVEDQPECVFLPQKDL
jgi:hypothetical protein